MGETAASAVARLAPRVPADVLRGNRIVALGDSITIGAGSDGWRFPSNSWFTWLSLLSGGRIQPVYNAGISGDTTAGMLARFDTAVTPYAPAKVILLGGTNDTGNAVALATTMANIAAIVAKCRAIKAEPILCTIPPNTSGAGTRHDAIARFNAAITHYALRHGLILIDFHSALVNEATGDYHATAAYNSDQTHPNGKGAYAMGVVAWRALSGILPYAAIPMAHHTADAANLLTNGLFLTDGDSNGQADFWSLAGSATLALETDAAILGKWQKMTVASGSAYITQNGAIGAVNPGDVIAFSGRIEILNAPSDCSVTARLRIAPTTASSTVDTLEAGASLNQAITGGVFSVEKTASASASRVVPELIVSGTGTVARFAQVTTLNLTALGVAA